MIYLISNGNQDRVKIGYTKRKTARKRIKELQTGNPERLRFVKIWNGTVHDEKAIHRRLLHRRVFNGGKSEWFNLTVTQALEVIPLILQSLHPTQKQRYQ